ncbi:unnamed protein product [Thlaspi arvense]|uniref:Uncharacterized protein n=1 Tax=Thlaspi arvense TaxID=13288 RepID=A0AAU9T684_THLAR|nr:unnamed protein product [Thlaspi arvense]
MYFPAIISMLRSYAWDECLPAFPVQLYEAWLLFFYAGLVMRENILRANGSDIKDISRKKELGVTAIHVKLHAKTPGCGV